MGQKGGTRWPFNSCGKGRSPSKARRRRSLTLHGRPGGSCSGLEPLADLADERPVVLYDQLGCGKSDRPNNPDLWRTDRFLAELRELIESLGSDRVHLMGASWGTMLAVDFVLAHPDRVDGLVLSNPCLSVTRWVTMWGPNDFKVTGTLANYERMDDLAAIWAPRLFACGRFDEATPESTRLFAARVPNSQLAIFENSAHMPMLEERDVYIDTLRSFLREVDAGEPR